MPRSDAHRATSPPSGHQSPSFLFPRFTHGMRMILPRVARRTAALNSLTRCAPSPRRSIAATAAASIIEMLWPVTSAAATSVCAIIHRIRFFHGADCRKPDEAVCLVDLSDGGGDAVEVREFDTRSGAFVDGGFRLNGQWSWGTCIVHGEWVMPVGIVAGEAPQLFLLPKSEVDLIDTWFVSGMCGTGSLDYRIDDVFVPEDHAVPLTVFFGEPGKSPLRYDAPIFQTPLGPILAFAAGLPLLGAAQGALDAWSAQTKRKLEEKKDRMGVLPGEDGKFSVAARVGLTLDAAELTFRQVLKELMEQRYAATRETRSIWMSRMSHAIFMARDAMADLATITGASGARLDNPIQRALRDIQTASNHAFFDRESRYADYGRVLTGQGARSMIA